MIRTVILIASLALLLSVLGGVWVAGLGAGQVLWATIGFECVALGSGVVALLAGLGKLREGLALSMLCIAGAVLVSGVFGQHFAAGPTLRSAILAGDASSSALRIMQLVVVSRIVLSGVFAMLAVLCVLSTSSSSWRSLGIGIGLLLPVMGLAVWLTRYNGAATLVGEIESALGVVRLIAALFGGLVLFVITAIGGHYVIKAFGGSPQVSSGDTEH